MQKVHAGLCDYNTIYERFPPTEADPLLGNRLAFYLCSEEDAIKRSERNSSVLLGEIATSQIDGEHIRDAFEGREMLLYAYTQPGTDDPRSPVDMPAELMSDDTDWTMTVYRPYRDGFELWSAGPDGLATTLRSDEENDDNVSVTTPFGELNIY
jgi:hypothetical protein